VFKEIGESRCLRLFGAGLAFAHAVTMANWIRWGHVWDILGDRVGAVCWPVFTSCRSATWLTGVPSILLDLAPLVFVVAAARLVGRRSWRSGWILFALGLLIECVISLQDLRLWHDGRVLGWISGAILLFCPRRKEIFPFLWVALNIGFGLSKLGGDWMSAADIAQLGVLHVAIGPLEAASVFALVMELFGSPLLLCPLPRLRWGAWAALTATHLVASRWAGWEFAVQSSAILAYFPLTWWLEPGPRGSFFWVRPTRPALVASVLALVPQLVTLPSLSRSALTQEKRWLPLSAHSSHPRCTSLFVARLPTGNVELRPPVDSLPRELQCDPWTYREFARAICERSAANSEQIEVDWSLEVRSAAILAAQYRLEVEDACAHPEGKGWLEGLPRFPDRASASPSEATFTYRGGIARDGIHPRALKSVGLTKSWTFEPLNVGVHTASKASPAVDASGIYVGADDGWFYALEHDGKLRWRYHVGGSELGIHGTAALDRDHAFVGTYNGRVYCFDKRDGKVLWNVRVGDQIGASPVLYENSLLISVELTGPQNGFIIRLKRDSGQVVWRSRRFGNHAHSSPAIDLATRTVSAGDNSGHFFVIDLDTGKMRSMLKGLGPIKSTPAVRAGRAYGTSWGKVAFSVDLNTGKRDWETKLDSKSMSSPAYGPAFDRLFFGSFGKEGTLYALDRSTGSVAWSTHVTLADLTASGTVLPAFGAHRSEVLLFPCTPKAVCAFDTRDGKRLAEIDVGGKVTGEPIVYEDSLFVALNDGGLIRLDPSRRGLTLKKPVDASN
jgi:outer membrane protein assembly factor BamB